MITSTDLIKSVMKRDPTANVNILRKAYMYALDVHRAQKRLSGSPYFSHPAEVANMLAEIGMDVPAIAAGLLHDVVEDADVSLEEIKELFGSEIAYLVDGVTKLSSLNYSARERYQAENIKKFLLAILHDLRTLVIKLMDRLHNLRTIGCLSLEKQTNMAFETLDIYAPLAERIGMDAIREEMEDISFRILHPNDYAFIEENLNKFQNEKNEFVSYIAEEIRKVLKKAEITAEVQGRIKKAYSVWRKMRCNNIAFDQVSDLAAFRVIIDGTTTDLCYKALGVIHTNYLMVPGRFKDYISVPKLSGYKSLHTAIMMPFKKLKQKVEVQICTRKMYRNAQYGQAAHYLYKNSEFASNASDIAQEYKWVSNLAESVKNSVSSEEALKNAKAEIYRDEVFCFTPDGKLINLPRGATSIDFAYEIHRDIGNTCIGARVNGVIRDIRAILKNGDQVEILTFPQSVPDPSWERFAVTGKAKSYIRKYYECKREAEFIKLGRQLVENTFLTYGVTFRSEMLDLKKFGCSELENFFHNVGKGIVSLNEICAIALSKKGKKVIFKQVPIILEDFTIGIAVHLSNCCSPVIGNSIVGEASVLKGLIVHRNDCANIFFGKKFISVKWNREKEKIWPFIVKMSLTLSNQRNSLPLVTNVISLAGGDIMNMRIKRQLPNLLELLMDIKVQNQMLLDEIQSSLRSCANVYALQRL